MTYTCISMSEVVSIVEHDATIVDIRDQASYKRSHMNDAILLGNDNVQDFIDQSDKQRPIIVYCYHGSSSKCVAEYLAAQGFKEVYSLNGGYS